MQKEIQAVQKLLDYEFKNQKLIVAALTHPSAAENQPVSASYERLEFLGDSILGAIVAKELFTRFPEMDEGGLTRMKISLVSGKTLSQVADSLGIGELIEFGESEKGTGARGLYSALENVYEAIVGSLYLDAGYEKTQAFVVESLTPYVSEELALTPISPKSKLQEVTQRDLHCAPTYKLIASEGPAHDPTFTSVAVVGGNNVGTGTGSSKKASETSAALDALERMGYMENLQRKES